MNSDLLIFKCSSGMHTCSVEQVVVGLVSGSKKSQADIRGAAALIFHHYNTYLERPVVAVDEFRETLLDILTKFDFEAVAPRSLSASDWRNLHQEHSMAA